MSSIKLVLISDEIELGSGLARIAILSSRLGERALGCEYQRDAEDCYARAESLAAGLSSPVDQESAWSKIEKLRISILAISEDRKAFAGVSYGRCVNFNENVASLLPG